MDHRLDIIQPALITIGKWSQVAEDILWGIGQQESGYIYTRQRGGGPALGYWQMEPFTHDDIWNTYLRYRPDLTAKINLLLPAGVDHVAQLETNHQYACAMARIKLLRAPVQLPKLGDIHGYAVMWKTVYNSAGGAGTVGEFVANYEAHNHVGA